MLASGLQKNFGKPVEWALVKDHAWSTPQLRKLDQPVRAVCFVFYKTFRLCKHFESSQSPLHRCAHAETYLHAKS